MTSEFEIIERYFKKKMKQTLLGVGDDAAIINLQKNHQRSRVVNHRGDSDSAGSWEPKICSAK